MKNKFSKTKKKALAIVLSVAMAIGIFGSAYGADGTDGSSEVAAFSVGDGDTYEISVENVAADSAGDVGTQHDVEDISDDTDAGSNDSAGSGTGVYDIATDMTACNIAEKEAKDDEDAASDVEYVIDDIEEDVNADAVRELEYDVMSENIVGYGILPKNPDMDSEYGLYGGYNGQDSMDDPDSAGSCVGWDDITTLSAVNGSSWWIDDYYVNESNQYDVTKTSDFSLKYQIEFHASKDIDAGEVQIVIGASLGTYRNGNNIIPTDLGIPYGTPDQPASSPSSPFNYYYIDASGNILTASQAKTATGVQLVIWNYKEIVSGSNTMFQVLYGSLDIMRIPDQTRWSLGIEATVGSQTVTAHTLSGTVDTAATVSAVSKTPYKAVDVSYTPELYSTKQVSKYINGDIPEPYATDFDDYIYIVWYVTLKGSATQAYEITIDESTFTDSQNGSVVGYKVYTSGTSNEVSYTYGTSSSGSPTLSFSSASQRSFNAAFYVVTAYDASTYEIDTEIENDVTVTLHPVDGYDADTVKSDSAVTTWGEYEWIYRGNGIGVEKWHKIENGSRIKEGTYDAHLDLYKINADRGIDTGEYEYSTESTDRGYAYTHVMPVTDPDTGTVTMPPDVGEWKGGYYTTTTVDDALYVYPEGNMEKAQMLTKDDYYFSSASITVNDYGYDVWEDETTNPTDYDGVDQDVYIYAMFYDQGPDADSEGWEYVAEVPFNTYGIMSYTFTTIDAARQPYRIKVVHSTADYVTYCTIKVGMTLRYDSPIIQECIREYGDDLTFFRIENLSGVAGQLYGISGYTDGTYFQDQSTDGTNYSEKDTKTGETLAEFTEKLYGTILMRDNAYVDLTELMETASAFKSVTTENDSTHGRVLANYYLTAYEAYYVTGEDTVDAFKNDDFYLPERQDVTYCDLLPYGMEFNPSTTVVAGRITTMNTTGTWKTNSGAWVKSGVSVTVDNDDVITNWNGTGRTMVMFHIHYDGSDASSFYDVPNSEDDLWFEGYGLYFQAYYDWENISEADAEYNIAAYIADNVTNESEQFLGLEDYNIYKDDGSAADLTAQYAPFDGVSDLNGDGITDWYTNMYCSATTTTNVATSSSDEISKKVRADDDEVAEYGSTAIVGEGRGYTYEITLKNIYGAELSDVVIFDHLEYAVEDGRAEIETAHSGSVYDGLSPTDIDNHWTGEFISVTTTALEDLGIAPVVYYNESRDATVSSSDGTIKPSSILTEANGWYTEDRFIEVYGSLSSAKSIAVDISKATDGSDYIMAQDTSVSFQIHMLAPEGSDYSYAFNNPMYYTKSTDTIGDITYATDAGNSVRVELGEAETLEVEKKFDDADDVPASMKNQNFTFEITRRGSVLANQEYMVYDWDESTDEWVSTGLIRATDINGRFTLKAGQKAVFSQLVDVEDIVVTEVPNIMWESWMDEDDSYSLDDGGMHYTFVNKYRSPVYLHKSAMTTAQATSSELNSATFTFLIEVDTDGDGEYEPYANGEYIYVKSILTDGSSPTIDTSKGDNGYGYTNENGEVTLGINDIIVFFPMDADGNYINVPYRITEVSMSNEDDWICEEDTTTGTTKTTGTSETIENYFKYRSLVITKDLSDYDHDFSDCDSEWTFQLLLYDPDNPDADADGYVPVSGNHWYIVDTTNQATGIEGNLDNNGYFTFSGAGTGSRVVIERLTRDATYKLVETDWDKEYFETVNEGTVVVTMPKYSNSKSVTVTNKYLLKDLSISKLVLSKEDDPSLSEHEFTFVLEKKNDDGTYSAVADETYYIEDVAYTTDADGMFTLTNLQEAVFDDIGYYGDEYRVTEIRDGMYAQIYPANEDPYDAVLGSDGDSVRFVNGEFDEIASITKTLNGLDDVGSAYVALIKEDNTADTLISEDEEVPYTVEVTYGVYDDDGIVTGKDGALIDYTENNSEYPYVYLKITRQGDVTLKSYNGGLITEDLNPYDYIFIAHLGDCTVRASESDELERVIYDTTDSTAKAIGSSGILSEGNVMSGSAAADEDIELINDISSANIASEIYKLMSDASDKVAAGSTIAFRVERYDEASDTWSPASGIRYITMDGYMGGYDTTGCVPTSSVLTTDLDGHITLTKSDNGYPYIRFVDDEVYVNVYSDMADGTLRIVEVASGTDEEWGWILGYDGDGWVDGPGLDVTYGDTFVDGNDDGLVFEVEKEMNDKSENDADFTFHLVHVISSTTSPITTLDEVSDSEVGADVYYIIYDVNTGKQVGDGYTDRNGCFTLKAGQYAKFFVPTGTTWYVYEGIMPSYVLDDVTANSDVADNASIVDDVNGVVQEETAAYATAKITLTLTDKDTGEPLAGGVFTLYKDGDEWQTDLVTDKNGQIVISGLTEGEYYFEETDAPDGYDLPEDPVSDTVKVANPLIKAESYDLAMTNEEEEVPVVKYAVKLWGICADTYSYDNGVTSDTASLTFGPATGANHLSDYVECDSATCIHKLSWDEIIAYCDEYQGDTGELTKLFGSCLENGCTKAVELTPNETLFNMRTVSNYVDNASYTGDGVSALLYLLHGTGSKSYSYGEVWNYTTNGSSASDRANIYSRSRIRATLTGDSTNIEAQLEAGGNNYYYADGYPLLNESNCLFSCFPANLQEAMVPRTTLNTGNSTSSTGITADDKTTYDKLFLFSLKETGITQIYDDGGGEDYGVNASNDDRIACEFSNANATAAAKIAWWSRSRNSQYNATFVFRVDINGGYTQNTSPSGVGGLSPGFCIK